MAANIYRTFTSGFSLKRGRIDSISHTISPHAPFRNYEDIRQHWKVTVSTLLRLITCQYQINCVFFSSNLSTVLMLFLRHFPSQNVRIFFVVWLSVTGR